MSRPFVVTIASEKGGVGKTTIATNLAVYLKALVEDLPVTIASFDNHFSIDQMFSLGSRPERSVADLLSGHLPEEVAVLGQYGVQYLASSRQLEVPDAGVTWLKELLARSDLSGILVLDTRPILDGFTEAALRTADLVLVPVKDRAALVNAGALRQILADEQREKNLWLLPSLVDTRARLNAEVRVHEYLVYAARERDYQVVDTWISKSPKVESLASGFSSRIQPVLTHARQTAVHPQMKRLAEFVLQASREASVDSNSAVRVRGGRRLSICPVCQEQAPHDEGHSFFDLRSRRLGFLHGECLGELIDGLDFQEFTDAGGVFAMTLDGPGLVGPDCRLTLHLCDRDGRLIMSEEVNLEEREGLAATLVRMTGRSLEATYRELSMVSLTRSAPDDEEGDGGQATMRRIRQQVLRELRASGYY